MSSMKTRSSLRISQKGNEDKTKAGINSGKHLRETRRDGLKNTNNGKTKRLKKEVPQDEGSDKESNIHSKNHVPMANSKSEHLDKKESDSSSESSSDEFLVPSQALDLDSDYFKIPKKQQDFSTIESKIFDGIKTLSDSEDSGCDEGISDHASNSITKTSPDKLKLEDHNSKEGKNLGCQKISRSAKTKGKFRKPKDLLSSPHSSKPFGNKGCDEHNSIQDKMTDKTIAPCVSPDKAKVEDHNSKEDKNLGCQILSRSVKTKGKIRITKDQDSSFHASKSSLENKCSIDVNQMDISQLLTLGEKISADSIITDIKHTHTLDSENDSSDWEEVHSSELKTEVPNQIVPKEGIQVCLEVPDQFHKRKKKGKGFDMEAHIKRRMNRIKREIQVLIHKSLLLCWIAHGNYVNSVLNHSELMGIALSIIPSQHCYPSSKTNICYLEQIVKWFSKSINVKEKAVSEIPSFPDIMKSQFEMKAAISVKYLVYMFVCILRSMGIKTRLVINLQPLPLKPSSQELCSLSQKSTTKTKSEKIEKHKEKKSSLKKAKATKVSPEELRKRRKIMPREEAVKLLKNTNSKSDSPVNASTSRKSSRERKSIPVYIDKNSDQSDNEDSTNKKDDGKLKRKRLDGKDQDNSLKSKAELRQTANSPKATNTKEKIKKSSKILENIKSSSSGSESEFKPPKVKIRKSNDIDRRVLSSDSETDTQKKGIDVWAEVFVEEEEKWICVDVLKAQVHNVKEIYKRASHPVTYVLAWNVDNTIKDVTRRYCAQYHTVTRKQRVDDEWWNETFQSFIGKPTAHDREEDEDLDRQLQDRPLPSSIGEYKNHPLYALQRHLLKFEAIYPPDAPTLGFVRGEPVYARECVHNLHSRETWVKEAKVVKLGESPYKIVKARPKYDKMSGRVITDLPLELFGIWQVEDYTPPVASNGIVPRNAYGNVELFKPCMLPKGTVHLQVPCLNRVARKLGIDCAPAVTGFDFHCGGSHPTFDGFVVCEEFKETLLAAWEQEQEESAKRQEEKLLKRVYGNWKRLIKGLLIRERLKAKYSFGDEPSTSQKKSKKSRSSKASVKRRKHSSSSSESD